MATIKFPKLEPNVRAIRLCIERKDGKLEKIELPANQTDCAIDLEDCKEVILQVSKGVGHWSKFLDMEQILSLVVEPLANKLKDVIVQKAKDAIHTHFATETKNPEVQQPKPEVPNKPPVEQKLVEPVKPVEPTKPLVEPIKPVEPTKPLVEPIKPVEPNPKS